MENFQKGRGSIHLLSVEQPGTKIRVCHVLDNQ